MISITHYEVYTDNGSGWKLEDRFSSDQRQEAFGLAKEKELEKVKVKIIKEVFDVQDNTYQEAVEYVSGLGASKSAKKKHVGYANAGSDASSEDEAEPEVEMSISGNRVMKAVLKLVVIVVLCLVFANLLLTLIAPIIESFVAEESVRPILFAVFFVLFLGLAVPLLLKKVPWYVFAERTAVVRQRDLNEKKFYDKAETIIATYNLNDNFDSSITPAFPEAPIEYKRYIVEFLSDIINNLDASVNLQDSFSKLGIKLVVYGGCLELSRYCGLKITEANSLLYEAFGVLDGEIADLEAFYDAKRSYRDNKVAIFLTGVGAYLMAQVIEERPMASHILKAVFAKWERQNNGTADNSENSEKEGVEANIMVKSMVSIRNELHFLDDAIPHQDEEAAKVSGDIRNIISNLLLKYHGMNVVEDNGITTIEFDRLNEAAKFAIGCLNDIEIYESELDDENAELKNSCVIIKYDSEDEPNLNPMIEDILEQVYDKEIVVTQPIANELQGEKYQFDFLGEKRLERTGKTMELYKLLYNTK